MTNKDNKHGRALNQRLFYIIFGIVLIFIASLLIYQGISAWEAEESQVEGAASSPSVDDSRLTLTYQGQVYQLKDSLNTILVMGIDKFQEDVDTDEESTRNDMQADFLSVLVVDESTGVSRILQINRDTMTKVPILDIFGNSAGTQTEQIALAHTYGTGDTDSCRNTAKAVSNLLYGVPIDHYISLTMDAVGMINDAIGGVEVTVMDDFSETDPTLVYGETVTLTGEHALNYVRSRKNMDDPTNTNRMARQNQYLTAFYQKLASQSSSNSNLIFKLVFDVSPYMVSDCSANQLSEILNSALSNFNGEIEEISGEAVKGVTYMEFYPDETALEEKVIDMFFEPVTE